MVTCYTIPFPNVKGLPLSPLSAVAAPPKLNVAVGATIELAAAAVVAVAVAKLKVAAAADGLVVKREVAASAAGFRPMPNDGVG